MRAILMLSLALLVSALPAWSQVALAQSTPGATPAPANPGAAPKPAPQPARRAAQPPARSGIAMTVVGPDAATIPDVTVEMTGPVTRDGVTDASGQLNFPGLQAGTYRLRFSGDAVVTFEREVTLRAGQIEKLSVRLNPAPPPPAPPPAPGPQQPPPKPAVAAAVGPLGEVQSVLVTDVLEDEFVGREPRRESLLACSGNMRTTMIQLNEPLPDRLYADADAIYYVLGGEGTVRLNERDTRIVTNGFVSVPRGATHAFTRRGNRPLILLAVLSGAPCEVAK